MRPKYLISEKIAFSIFAILVVFPIFYIYYNKNYSEKRNSIKKSKILQIEMQIDSLKSIQLEIIDYDLANQNDSIIKNCNCLPVLNKDTNIDNLNLDELIKDVEFQSVEELERRQQILSGRIDSMNKSIQITMQIMQQYEIIYDTISPQFSLSMRSNIQEIIDSLRTETVDVSEKHLSQLKLDNRVTHFFIYYIRFLYLILIILFPVRWVTIYFYNRKRD